MEGTVAESTLLEVISSRLRNDRSGVFASALCTGLKLCRTFTVQSRMRNRKKVRTSVRNRKKVRTSVLATKYAFQALCQAIAHLPWTTSSQFRLSNASCSLAEALGGLLPADPDSIFGGSRNLRIQALAIEIDDICIQFDIDRRKLKVPRNLNTVAYYMAKMGAWDCYSSMLRPECSVLHSP